MPKTRTVRAFSAGGVVFRHPRTRERDASAPAEGVDGAAHAEQAVAPTGTEVVLVGRAAEAFWVLPKGTPAPNETIPEVALREVREETGVTARILGEVGSVHYWFSRKGTRFNKEVFYFLMEATGGDVSLHDHEYDDARWFPLDEAPGRLTYENEAELLRRAADMIARLPDAGDGSGGGAAQ